MYHCKFCGYNQNEPMTNCPECIRSQIVEIEGNAEKPKAPKAKKTKS